TGAMSRVSVEKLCERLHKLSLLLRYDLATRTIRLHDVMRAHLARELAKQSDLRAVHAQLLDAWGDPCSLPDDYAWRWYAWHMVQAGRELELRKLLLDFNWLRAKLANTDITALISDYDTTNGVPERKAEDRMRDGGALPGRAIGIPPWRCVDPDERGASQSPGLRSLPPSPLLLVQGALRLSAHVLAQDKTQLPSQLIGRLLWNQESPIQHLLSQAAKFPTTPWLEPKTTSLTPPGGPLLRTLTGHTGEVTAVAVTPDGKQAVSASWDNTLKVWDLTSGKELRTLTGHTGWVTAVAVTPDGKQAISGSEDKTLKVWDLASGKELRTLTGHTGAVTAVAVTPDGKQAVSASSDNTLKVWDLTSGKCLATFTADAPLIACAAASDGVTIVAGDQSGVVHFLALKGVQRR
ncbi:MAG: WD40 repeat domain-containing protein, partial [Terriglobia bacterium]